MRPQLAARYRFADSHTLHGHSLGGMLAGYSLFARPDAFDRMIIGSPVMVAVDDAVFKAEEAFAKTNTSLPVELFVGAGGNEGNVWFLNADGILSGTARFMERLNLRGYEGMEVQSQFYTGENHYTVVPRIISDALRHFHREDAAGSASTWPGRPE